jgi:ferredoxin
MEVRLIVDLDACVSYGECVAEDSEAMELDENGQSRFRLAAVDFERASRICAACPVGAIKGGPVT